MSTTIESSTTAAEPQFVPPTPTYLGLPVELRHQISTYLAGNTLRSLTQISPQIRQETYHKAYSGLLSHVAIDWKTPLTSYQRRSNKSKLASLLDCIEVATRAPNASVNVNQNNVNVDDNVCHPCSLITSVSVEIPDGGLPPRYNGWSRWTKGPDSGSRIVDSLRSFKRDLMRDRIVAGDGSGGDELELQAPIFSHARLLIFNIQQLPELTRDLARVDQGEDELSQDEVMSDSDASFDGEASSPQHVESEDANATGAEATQDTSVGLVCEAQHAEVTDTGATAMDEHSTPIEENRADSEIEIDQGPLVTQPSPLTILRYFIEPTDIHLLDGRVRRTVRPDIEYTAEINSAVTQLTSVFPRARFHNTDGSIKSDPSGRIAFFHYVNVEKWTNDFGRQGNYPVTFAERWDPEGAKTLGDHIVEAWAIPGETLERENDAEETSVDDAQKSRPGSAFYIPHVYFQNGNETQKSRLRNEIEEGLRTESVEHQRRPRDVQLVLTLS